MSFSYINGYNILVPFRSDKFHTPQRAPGAHSIDSRLLIKSTGRRIDLQRLRRQREIEHDK